MEHEEDKTNATGDKNPTSKRPKAPSGCSCSFMTSLSQSFKDDHCLGWLEVERICILRVN